jgi:hypothetical protein
MKMRNSYLDPPYAFLPFLRHLSPLIIQIKVQLLDSSLLFAYDKRLHHFAFTRQASHPRRMLKTLVAFLRLQIASAFTQTSL